MDQNDAIYRYRHMGDQELVGRLIWLVYHTTRFGVGTPGTRDESAADAQQVILWRMAGDPQGRALIESKQPTA